MTGSNAQPLRHKLADGTPGTEFRARVGERSRELARFGYSEYDAAFLAASALLGSYFLRRQYRAWGGRKPGSSESRFLSMAEQLGHAKPLVRKSLYCIHSRQVFAAIGWSGRAGRPLASRRYVKQRLLALDYLIESGDGHRWLLDEAEKVAYFRSLGIDGRNLPSGRPNSAGKVRHFPSAFPIRAAGTGRPEVEFVYAHCSATALGMEKHLSCHEPLASGLRAHGIDCAWTVLADSPNQFPRLRRAWRHWRDKRMRDWAELEYFSLRQAVKTRQWRKLNTEKALRYAELYATLDGPGTESRYRTWLDKGAPERVLGGDFALGCRYREVLLHHDYGVADYIEQHPA